MVARGTLVLLIFLSGVIFLIPLPYMDITGGHEAREGLRLHEIVTTGNWVFSEVLRKPPLFYWMGGLIAHLRGGTVDVVSLRLPSGLLAGCGVVVVWGLGRHATTPTGGLLAALILLTSPLYVWLGYNGRTDMTLCFFITLSLLLFFTTSTRSWQARAYEVWAPYLFFAALAFALLTKGPVALILVGLPVVGFLTWRRDRSGGRALLRPGPVFFFVVLGCGWYLWAAVEAGADFWRTQLLEENVSRFTGGIDTTSPFYYLEPLLSMFAPWSLLLPFALWQAVKERKQNQGPFFLALWWTAVVLFFQLSAYKRSRYLLPAYPAAALLVGWWLATQLPAATPLIQGWRWWRPVVSLLSVAVGLGAVAGLFVLHALSEEGLASLGLPPSFVTQETQEKLVWYSHWVAAHFWSSVIVWSLFSLCLLLLLRFLAHVRLRPALVSFFLALLLIYTAWYPSWLVVSSRAISPQRFVDNIVEKMGAERQVFFIGPSADKGFPVLFYLRERARLTEVSWPPGAPPPPLPSGYYLVAEERRAELTSQVGGQWTEVLRDTGPSRWPVVLFSYTPL